MEMAELLPLTVYPFTLLLLTLLLLTLLLLTVKILKFGTPQTIAISDLKLVKFDVTLH